MPPVQKLTKRVIDAARPRKVRYDLMCEALPGFGIRIFPSGGKSFFVYYRLLDRTARRLTIGAYGESLTSDQARKVAAGHLLRVRQGEDPAAERRAIRRAPKFDDLLV
jgi:hypothetical protein